MSVCYSYKELRCGLIMVAPSNLTESSVFIFFITLLCPPLAIYLLKGCGPEVIIGTCLTLLAWIPGTIVSSEQESVPRVLSLTSQVRDVHLVQGTKMSFPPCF